MTIRIRRALLSAFALSMLITALPAAAVTDVAGVKFEDTARVANQELKLNGAGVRYKAIFKVYAVGIYLSDKKTTVPAILAATGARRIQIGMLRDVTNEEFGSGFMSGVQKNTDRAEKGKMINQLIKLGELFSTVPELKKGDVLTTDWVPGVGTVFQLNGKKIAEPLPDVAFYNAILRIWLGEKPIDAKLKYLLMGEKPEETRGSFN